MNALRLYVEHMDCKRVDDDIEEMVRMNSALADCRALDAIHIATALFFKPHHDAQITIVTLDRRMGETAGRLGFPVLPEVMEPRALKG